jgi:hypothetical protein
MKPAPANDAWRFKSCRDVRQNSDARPATINIDAFFFLIAALPELIHLIPIAACIAIKRESLAYFDRRDRNAK